MGQINIHISDDSHKKFNIIKDKVGMKNNTEVLEFLIDSVYSTVRDMKPIRKQVKIVKGKITLSDSVEVEKSK